MRLAWRLPHDVVIDHMAEGMVQLLQRVLGVFSVTLINTNNV